MSELHQESSGFQNSNQVLVPGSLSRSQNQTQASRRGGTNSRHASVDRRIVPTTTNLMFKRAQSGGKIGQCQNSKRIPVVAQPLSRNIQLGSFAQPPASLDPALKDEAGCNDSMFKYSNPNHISINNIFGISQQNAHQMHQRVQNHFTQSTLVQNKAQHESQGATSVQTGQGSGSTRIESKRNAQSALDNTHMVKANFTRTGSSFADAFSQPSIFRTQPDNSPFSTQVQDLQQQSKLAACARPSSRQDKVSIRLTHPNDALMPNSDAADARSRMRHKNSQSQVATKSHKGVLPEPQTRLWGLANHLSIIQKSETNHFMKPGRRASSTIGNPNSQYASTRRGGIMTPKHQLRIENGELITLTTEADIISNTSGKIDARSNAKAESQSRIAPSREQRQIWSELGNTSQGKIHVLTKNTENSKISTNSQSHKNRKNAQTTIKIGDIISQAHNYKSTDMRNQVRSMMNSTDLTTNQAAQQRILADYSLFELQTENNETELDVKSQNNANLPQRRLLNTPSNAFQREASKTQGQRTHLSSIKKQFVTNIEQKTNFRQIKQCKNCATHGHGRVQKQPEIKKIKESQLDYNMDQLREQYELKLQSKANQLRSPDKKAKRPLKGELEKLFEFIDHNLHHHCASTEAGHQHHQQDFNQMATRYRVDEGPVDGQYQEKFKRFKEAFQEYLQSYSAIKEEKDHYSYIKFMDNNAIIVEMIDRAAKDYEFREQIQHAKPETKEFINAIVKTFELLDLKKKPMTAKDIIQKLQESSEKAMESQQQGSRLKAEVKDMGKAIEKTLKKAIDRAARTLVNAEDSKFKKNQIEGMDLVKLFNMQKQYLMKQSELAGGQIVRRGEFMRKGRVDYSNPAIQKFRRLIERNFLKKKTLEFYENMSDSKVNCNLIVQLYILKRTLNQMFPAAQYANIGQKCDYLDKSCFINEFYYGIYNNGETQQDQDMMQAYFSLYDLPKLKMDALSNDDHHVASGESLELGAGPHKHRTRMCLSEGKMDLNNLFITQIDKEKFYKQIKKFTLGVKEYNDLERNAIMEYNIIQGKKQIVPSPNFVSFSEHYLFLSQQRISEEEAEALRHYLKKTGAVVEKRVHRLIIEQCSMTDDALNKVLDGIIGQSMVDIHLGNIKMQYLQSLIYSNNELGLKSLKNIKALIPHIFELGLNNIRLDGGYLDKQLYNCSDVVEEILRTTASAAKKLMKLKLTKMNLRHEGIIHQLCGTLGRNKNMILLDLSHGQLLPKQLNAVSLGVSEMGANLRSLNLSYNLVNQDGCSDSQDSEQFMANINKFIKVAKYVNHLNFSGMNFKKPQIFQLIEILRNCEFLLALHLSDNGITRDKELYYDCLEEFQITEEDLLEINRSKRNEVKLHPKYPKKYDKLDIDYKGYLKEYFDFETFVEDHAGHGHGKSKLRKLYKDRILLGKQQKIVDQFKAINKAQVYYGLGRQIDQGMDRFVLTRYLNMPGLVFNQRIKNDYTKQRFFNLQQSSGWLLSKENECYVCQQYQMTLVFYNRSPLALNQDLIEIKNKEFVNQLKRDFLGNYSKFYSKSPIICGTLVNGGIGQPQFDRKLKMMKASVYGLLQLMQQQSFTTEKEHQGIIQETMTAFLQTESYPLLESLGINEKLEGWEKLVRDKCLSNELMDMKNINIPDFSKDQKGQDQYVYAAYLKPGYHQLLIYDPLVERAYCKDFVVNLNLREDIFPEFPVKDPQPMKKRIANVWRYWLDDSQEDIFKSFQGDLEHQSQFLIHKYIRCPIDAGNSMNIIMDNFDIIKIYQKHLQFSSTQYPQIDWWRVWSHFEVINVTSNHFRSEKMRATRAQAELAFIGATRCDDTRGLRSAIQRAELYEFILRLAAAWVEKVYSPKEKVHLHLQEFIDLYITPFYEQSIILTQRKAIRDIPWLNQLLYDNLKGLEEVFELAKNTPGQNLWRTMLGKAPTEAATSHSKRQFTVVCAFQMLQDLQHEDYTITPKMIEQCFQFSQMTVHSEYTNMSRYNYLIFVEFLDMLCRIAIVAVTKVDTLDYKTHFLLELIYAKYQKSGRLSGAFPLLPVDEILR